MNSELIKEFIKIPNLDDFIKDLDSFSKSDGNYNGIPSLDWEYSGPKDNNQTAGEGGTPKENKNKWEWLQKSKLLNLHHKLIKKAHILLPWFSVFLLCSCGQPSAPNNTVKMIIKPLYSISSDSILRWDSILITFIKEDTIGKFETKAIVRNDSMIVTIEKLQATFATSTSSTCIIDFLSKPITIIFIIIIGIVIMGLIYPFKKNSNDYKQKELQYQQEQEEEEKRVERNKVRAEINLNELRNKAVIEEWERRCEHKRRLDLESVKLRTIYLEKMVELAKIKNTCTTQSKCNCQDDKKCNSCPYSKCTCKSCTCEYECNVEKKCEFSIFCDFPKASQS